MPEPRPNRPRRARAALVAVAALAAFATGACAPQTRRAPPAREPVGEIPNGSFEDPGPGCPRGWHCPPAGAEAVETAAPAGARALRLRRAPGAPEVVVRSDPMAVEPGLYELRGWFRFEAEPAEGHLAARALFDLAVEPAAGVGEEADPAPTALLAGMEGVAAADLEDWTPLVLRPSAAAPGLEVDAPARALRVVVRVNGRGTLWVDGLALARTRWNRTLRARVAPLLGEIPEGEPVVFPTPRHLDWEGEEAEVVGRDRAAIPCLAGAREGAAAAEGIAAFRQTLTLLAGRAVAPRPVEDVAADPESRCSLVVSLERTGIGDREAYAIEPTAGASPPWVRLTAGGGRGLYYAFATLSQLLRPGPEPGTVRVALAEVRDGPGYALRGISGWGRYSRDYDREVELARWAPAVKLNAFFFNYPALGNAWWAPGDAYWRAIATLGAERRAHDLFDLGTLVNVYAARGRDPEADFRFSDSDDRARAVDTVRRMVAAGASHVMVCADDLPPRVGPGSHDYGLGSAPDRERFGTLAGAHVHLLADLRRAAEGATMSFVPPWYNNAFWRLGGDAATDYLAEVGVGAPARMPFVWTGPAVRSLHVDAPQIERFRRAVGGRPLILWDNTLYARAHRDLWRDSPTHAHRASWFEPYGAALPDDGPVRFVGLYLNGHATERFRVQYMTAADFLWNPDAYDPDRSLARALTLLYGRALAERILEWDERHWEARERWNRARAGGPAWDDAALAAVEEARARIAADPDADPRLVEELEALDREFAAAVRRARGAPGR